MKFTYGERQSISEEVGNNSFSWNDRKIGGNNPVIHIPPLVYGDITNIEIGGDVVFEEMKDGKIQSCIGLKNFIESSLGNIPIIIFDNHNHALYFWIRAIQKGIIKGGAELIHIDEHSDLWENKNILDLSEAIRDDEYNWKFTNYSCNVGNYIQPAIYSGVIGKMIRVENEFQIDQYTKYIPQENSILNIDLDIFAPEMDFISDRKKITLIQNIIPYVKLITVATSPYFIDQKLAIEKLHLIFQSKK